MTTQEHQEIAGQSGVWTTNAAGQQEWLPIGPQLQPTRLSGVADGIRRGWTWLANRPAVLTFVSAIVGAGIALAVALPLTGDHRSASGAEGPAATSVFAHVSQSCTNGQISIDGKSVEIHTSTSLAPVTCWLAGLDAPDWIADEMGQTRALDGTMRASWGNYEASWNYHPDNGFNVVIHTVA